MAVQTATSAPCKRLLIPLLLLSIFPLMQCRMYVSKVSTPVHEPLGLRIDLVHRDSPLSPVFAGNITSTERFALAVQRSRERLERLQMSVFPKAHRSEEKVKQLEAPVNAGHGEFMMTIAIGRPALSFSAILDTGSDLIWTQCQPCNNCYNQSTPIYDPSLSSGYKSITCKSSQCQALDSHTCAGAMCQYIYSYGDSSLTEGILSSETFTLSSRSVHHIVFGCAQDIAGDFGEGAGLVGFGRGPLSLISQLSPSGGNKFSYCLMSTTDSTSKASPLFVGHTATLNATTVRSTPLITSNQYPTFYYLSLEGISVGGQLLNITPGTFDLQSDGTGGVVIDSGTTVTFLQSDAYHVLAEALSSSINLSQADGRDIVGLDLCWTGQAESSSADFPTITFHFKGADYDLPKENYIYSHHSGILCLAMLPAEASDMSIFGNLQQQNYQILYDNGNNMLSFAPTVCDTLTSSSLEGKSDIKLKAGNALNETPRSLVDNVNKLCEEGRLIDALRFLYVGDKREVRNTYACLLKVCINLKAITEGKRIHAHMIKTGFKPGIFFGNRLVDMYVKYGRIMDASNMFQRMPERNVFSWTIMIAGLAKCGKIMDTRQLFDKMPERNVVSWTALLSGYAQFGHSEEALRLFCHMQQAGIKADEFAFASASSACASLTALEQGRQELHSFFHAIVTICEDKEIENVKFRYHDFAYLSRPPSRDIKTMP